jgi:hypothetical protein
MEIIGLSCGNGGAAPGVGVGLRENLQACYINYLKRIVLKEANFS